MWHITDVTSLLLGLTFSIKKNGDVLTLMGIHLAFIQFVFFSWPIRQCASFMTHLAFNSVRLSVKENTQNSLSLYHSPKKCQQFPSAARYSSTSTFWSIPLLSLLPLNTIHLNRSQQSPVHPQMHTLIHTFPTPGISSHIQILPSRQGSPPKLSLRLGHLGDSIGLAPDTRLRLRS